MTYKNNTLQLFLLVITVNAAFVHFHLFTQLRLNSHQHSHPQAPSHHAIENISARKNDDAQIICSPRVHRPHKTHSLCTSLLESESAALQCRNNAHCLSMEAMQRLCGVTIHSSMENYGSCVEGDDHNICMSVNSASDVHMQYFSWGEINFFAGKIVPFEHRNEGILASFVSNCVQWRTDYLSALTSELQGMGQIVHNYGQCAHNTAMVDASGDKYLDKKTHSLRHKFLFAFENSETDGYVTEKLFYALSDGAVAVYRGAPNVRRYLPAPNAAIIVPPDMTPAQLAALLVIEGSNATAYNQRLQWKHSSVHNLNWIAEMDLSISHSQCRACQRILDMESQPLYSRGVRIRERGDNNWVDIPTNAFETFKQLAKNISLTFSGPAHEKPNGAGRLIHMYDLWDRNRCPITTIQQFDALPSGSQIEVIMENPGWTMRNAL